MSSNVNFITQVQSSSYLQPGVSSSVKTGKETVELTANDLFDKVINAKFIRSPKEPGAEAKTFTIRSDYEVKFNSDGTYFYKDCDIKPSIKISYKPIPGNMAVGMYIEISNLYIEDEALFFKTGEPIYLVEIQVGYKKQFPDWVRDPVFSSLPLEDFYALKDYTTTVDQNYKLSGTRLLGNVLSINRSDIPPDNKIVIHCAIVNMDIGLRWTLDINDLEDRILKNAGSEYSVRKPKNSIPYIFFNLVTRRFVNSKIRHYAFSSENTVYEEQKQDVTVKRGPSKNQIMIIFDENYKAVKNCELVDGVLSIDDANTFGTVVYISDRLLDMPIEELPRWGMTESQIAQLEPFEQPLIPVMSDSITGQLLAIANEYPYIRYYQLPDGNYYAYHVNEDVEAFLNDSGLYNNQREGIIQLPAIYNIQWNGVPEIQCPFYSFLGMMQTVAFKSRYVLSELAGFYVKPENELALFVILTAEISFSTTGDENNMTLRGVIEDKRGKFIQADDGSIIRVEEVTGFTEEQQRRNKVWMKKELEIVDYFTTSFEDKAPSNWGAIINRMLDTSKSYISRWQKEKGREPTKADALELLKQDNPELFTDLRLTHMEPVEKRLIAETGIEVPILYGPRYVPDYIAGPDKVIIRDPFLPSYRSEEEVV